ncbi:hypothetical protein BKA65DRAFT_99466 [Rhexocercosporidium sp. MPI-PUGE-AT-0058]|nr:hypothetical protein BKA65DRAFT_99466 [Rhexocercosporidium sp. MPI-PUGE-AT-0058]
MTARLCRDWVDGKTKMSFTVDAKPVFSSLIALCSKYGGANCGDPRDKIFGLHSLAEGCCRVEVPVDYGLQLPQLHRQVLEHCMTQHKRWDSIIGASQEFHTQLKISISEYMNPSGGRLNISRSDAGTQLVGYSTSVVIYASPLNLAYPGKLKPIPITRECHEELSKAYQLNSTKTLRMKQDFKLAASAYPQHGSSPAENPKAISFFFRNGYKLNRDDIELILRNARILTSGVSMTRTRIAVCTQASFTSSQITQGLATFSARCLPQALS